MSASTFVGLYWRGECEMKGRSRSVAITIDPSGYGIDGLLGVAPWRG